MSAAAFDALGYVRRVVAAGVPREQAEAQAEAMKDAFDHNLDRLVTREYLDSRFAASESHMDQRISELRLEVRGEMGDLRSVLNLHSWMLGLLVVTTVVPALLKILA